jgi:hypothetical protein
MLCGHRKGPSTPLRGLFGDDWHDDWHDYRHERARVQTRSVLALFASSGARVGAIGGVKCLQLFSEYLY